MLRKILPHVSILLSNMYIVFFLIDRVNGAMAFINNDLTKWLLVIASVVSIANALMLIREERSRIRREEMRRAQQRAAARRSRSAAPQGRI